jgi:hypothetical protein
MIPPNKNLMEILSFIYFLLQNEKSSDFLDHLREANEREKSQLKGKKAEEERIQQQQEAYAKLLLNTTSETGVPKLPPVIQE